jgi:hypothetical protein
VLLATRGQIEGEAEDALDTETGVDRLLSRHFTGLSTPEDASGPRIEALGVFPDDHKVALLWIEARNRSRHPGIETDWSQVDVEVEVETELEEKPSLEDSRRHRRGTHRPEENGIVCRELVLNRLREDFSGFEVPVASEVVGSCVVAEFKATGGCR